MTELISQNFGLHSWKIPAQAKGMKVFHLQNLTYVDSGLSCDTFNVIHISNGHLLAESEITEAVNHFRQKDFAYCVWISEENLTENAKLLFEKISLAQQNMEPGMILDLLQFEPSENELHINAAIAANHQEVADYAAVIAANWSPPDINVVSYFQQTAPYYLDQKNNIILAVYHAEGKLVSTIEMFPSDSETIGLYSLATLKAYRGKGIGSALMSFALNKAKALGYKRAILQASEEGIGIYKRLGFAVYTKYYEYA